VAACARILPETTHTERRLDLPTHLGSDGREIGRSQPGSAPRNGAEFPKLDAEGCDDLRRIT